MMSQFEMGLALNGIVMQMPDKMFQDNKDRLDAIQNTLLELYAKVEELDNQLGKED